MQVSYNGKHTQATSNHINLRRVWSVHKFRSVVGLSTQNSGLSDIYPVSVNRNDLTDAQYRLIRIEITDYNSRFKLFRSSDQRSTGRRVKHGMRVKKITCGMKNQSLEDHWARRSRYLIELCQSNKQKQLNVALWRHRQTQLLICHFTWRCLSWIL